MCQQHNIEFQKRARPRVPIPVHRLKAVFSFRAHTAQGLNLATFPRARFATHSSKICQQLPSMLLNRSMCAISARIASTLSAPAFGSVEGRSDTAKPCGESLSSAFCFSRSWSFKFKFSCIKLLVESLPRSWSISSPKHHCTKEPNLLIDFSNTTTRIAEKTASAAKKNIAAVGGGCGYPFYQGSTGDLRNQKFNPKICQHDCLVAVKSHYLGWWNPASWAENGKCLQAYGMFCFETCHAEMLKRTGQAAIPHHNWLLLHWLV